MPQSSQFQRSDMYLVDPNLRAVPLTQIYGRQDQWISRDTRVQAEPTGAPIAVSPDGTLAAGVLYESSTEPQVRYFLPQYALLERGGLFRVQLKWTADPTAPNAPFARLSIEVVAQTPNAPNVTLREIEHQAVVRLGYHLPVAAGEPEPAANSAPAFWYEIGALQPVEGQVRRCQMDIFAKQDFDRLYQIMTDASFGGVLEMRCFATIGHRSYRQVVVCDPPWTPNLPVAFLGRPRVGAATLGPEAGDERIFQVMPAAAIEPEAGEPLTLDGIDTTRLANIAMLPVQLQTPIRATPAQPIVAAPVALPIISQIAPQRTDPVPQVAQIAFGDAVRQIDWDVVKTKPATTINARQLIRDSDFIIDRTDIVAMPVGTFVEGDGKPVLLRVDAEATQYIRPFAFPVETNGYIFDIPGSVRPTESHKLQPHTVPMNDGRIGRFYYDLGLDMFYYQPTEFRLSRLAHPLDQSSYQPYLAITMVNVVTTEGTGGDATTSCRVNLTYQALPCIEPDMLDAASDYFKRNNIHPAPKFTSLNPVRSKLTLFVPNDIAGTQFDHVERPDTTIDFNNGLVDNLNISDTQFEPIAAALLVGLGLRGTVEVYLLSEQSAPITVNLRLALNDTAGPLFEPTLLGPVDNTTDRYNVRLTNRVESPARIDRLDTVIAGESALAYPQTAGGAVLQPGESQTIEYKVVPATTPLRKIDPIISGSVILDDEAQRKQLWRRLIIEQGYTSSTFTVAASIDPMYFDSTPPGMQPLVGLRVDFRGGGSVVLTKTSPAQSVTLQQGYLSTLLGDPLSYRYTVTNLHADPSDGAKTVDGAHSDLLNDEVPELRVEPAI